MLACIARIAFIGWIARCVVLGGFLFFPAQDLRAGFCVAGMLFRYYLTLRIVSR